MFMLYLNGFVQTFSKFGRYTDLLAGLVMLALAAWWRSPITAGLAAISITAYAVDLNGMVQRKSMAWAKRRVIAKGARR